MAQHPNRFAPERDDIRAAIADSQARWAHYGQIDCSSVSFEALRAAYEAIHGWAEHASGTTLDARKRAVTYFSIYEDSRGNLMFPLIASHGSMWGVTHTIRIDRVLRLLRPLLGKRRSARWMQALDDVRDVNRRVFVEIYSTFYFTRFFGKHPEAGQIVHSEVLDLYNRVHDAVEADVLLPYSERRDTYYTVFVHEQHDIVDPGVHEAAQLANSPLIRFVLSHVRPRFTYFPKGERLHFSDFTSIDQRNREGLRACDLGEQVGADRVLQALGEY